MPLYNPSTESVTKRVTMGISGEGKSGTRSDTTDFLQRVLVVLPVTPTRFRIRFRNADATGTARANALSVAGFWIGPPSIPSTGDWAGAFASAPTQILNSFTTDSAGAEYTSAWIDNAGYLTRNVIAAIGFGLTCAAGTVIPYSTFNSVYSNAAGSAAAAGNTAAPSSPQYSACHFDVRLEYEFSTPAVGGVPVGMFVGDSLMSGITGFDGHGCWPHDNIAGASGMRNGFAWTNIAFGGARISDWTGAISGSQWTRCDLATTIPDFACILLGTNDVLSSTAIATMKSGLRTVISNVESVGVPRGRIFVGTVPSVPVTGAQETLRQQYNTEVAFPVAGFVGGLLDFDKAVGADSDLIPSGVNHLTHRGYHKMASLVGPVLNGV